MDYSCTRYPWLVIEKFHAVGNVLVEFMTTTRHLARVECPSVLLLLAYADTACAVPDTKLQVEHSMREQGP